MTDGGYQNGAVINRDAKFPSVVNQTEETLATKEVVNQQKTMQMENVSDFDESFLKSEQDVISTQDTDAETLSDAEVNTDGIGNE